MSEIHSGMYAKAPLICFWPGYLITETEEWLAQLSKRMEEVVSKEGWGTHHSSYRGGTLHKEQLDCSGRSALISGGESLNSHFLFLEFLLKLQNLHAGLLSNPAEAPLPRLSVLLYHAASYQLSAGKKWSWAPKTAGQSA